MNWETMILPSVVIFILIMWFQRKTILELENEVWELEQAYKKETGKHYISKSRLNNIKLDNE